MNITEALGNASIVKTPNELLVNIDGRHVRKQDTVGQQVGMYTVRINLVHSEIVGMKRGNDNEPESRRDIAWHQ